MGARTQSCWARSPVVMGLTPSCNGGRSPVVMGVSEVCTNLPQENIAHKKSSSSPLNCRPTALPTMSSLFHNKTETIKAVQVSCSDPERKSFEYRSTFFVHPFFNGETEWPQKTSLVCFYDNHPFDSFPLPLPIDYDSVRNTYTCYGMFCSPSCVKAYMESSGAHNTTMSMIWLVKIMCEVFGDRSLIVSAPPLDVLQTRGGQMTIEEFRAFGNRKVQILAHRPPFLPCQLAFELVRNPAIRTTPVEGNPGGGVPAKPPVKLSAKAPGKSKSAVPPSPSFAIPPPPVLVTAMETDQSTTDAIPSPLLPPTIHAIPAEMDNRWDIRGLKRPSTAIKQDPGSGVLTTNTPYMSNGLTQDPQKSLFDEHLALRQAQPKSNPEREEFGSSKPVVDTKRRGRRKKEVGGGGGTNSSSFMPTVSNNGNTLQMGTLVSFFK